MADKKRNIQQYLDSLVDDEGLKTDVKITMTDETLWKMIGGLILAGAGIALVAHIIKNVVPNKHLAENREVLLRIEQGLRAGKGLKAAA